MLYTLHESVTAIMSKAHFSTKVTTQPVKFDLDIEVDTFDVVDLVALRDQIRSRLARVNQATFLSVEDPYIIKLLEPKTGNTVHNFLQKVKDLLQETAHQVYYTRLGGTVPRDTLNGEILYVFSEHLPVCNESIVSIVREEILHGLDESTNLRGVTIRAKTALGTITVYGGSKIAAQELTL